MFVNAAEIGRVSWNTFFLSSSPLHDRITSNPLRCALAKPCIMQILCISNRRESRKWHGRGRALAEIESQTELHLLRESNCGVSPSNLCAQNHVLDFKSIEVSREIRVSRFIFECNSLQLKTSNLNRKRIFIETDIFSELQLFIEIQMLIIYL